VSSATSELKLLEKVCNCLTLLNQGQYARKKSVSRLSFEAFDLRRLLPLAALALVRVPQQPMEMDSTPMVFIRYHIKGNEYFLAILC